MDAPPHPEQQNRRLAAVMFLDMVGYSALMSRSESRALACVQELERLMRAEVPLAGGRLVKFMGDGSMAEFPTAVAAVRCTQRVLAAIEAYNARVAPGERFNVRVGLHLGELVDVKDDIFSDAVNVAARVQPLADPGGIAMTHSVHAQVKNQLSLRGVYLPPRKLKNIPDRTRIFLVPPAGAGFFRWSLRRRGAPRLGLAALVLVLALGSWLAYHHYANRLDPNRLGLLFVRTVESDEQGRNLAIAVQDEIDAKSRALRNVQWINREAVLDLFDQEGIADLQAVEKLEVKACSAARRGGIGFAITARLDKLAPGQWQLNSKVVCTRSRTVVGSFSTQGVNAHDLAAATVKQIQVWAGQNLSLDEN